MTMTRMVRRRHPNIIACRTPKYEISNPRTISHMIHITMNHIRKMNCPSVNIKSIKVTAIDDMRMAKYSTKKRGRMFFIDRGVDHDRRNFGIGKCEQKRMLGCLGEDGRVCMIILVPAIRILSLLAKYKFYLNLFFSLFRTYDHCRGLTCNVSSPSIIPYPTIA